ncbi:hypothetical protein I8752_29100 [Nostocaceae cyanobacterium CENA369]|uniref:Uncharacterized protein n=1 Tax=Dendronalium phyllosphericum CENA369 TaxID=1725256 RepID=A0A8J7LMA4_9NOST|nr:hypothetical protein [Dendronalium phyllosphericum]MBH8576969.1 hypothetical protein [Dendronalium phyllosphericum CENA369]
MRLLAIALTETDRRGVFKAKFHLDKLIQEIAPLEYASINVDESINNDLDKIIAILSDTYIEIEETESPDEAT